MTIETYATVHHIVSNVRGVLRDDVTPGRAIAAVFPGGTITGCPKVRCMEMLAGLEREPRDAYTGSLGYLDLDGRMDLNILIRTLTVRDGEIGFRTGAGIVADSVPRQNSRRPAPRRAACCARWESDVIGRRLVNGVEGAGIVGGRPWPAVRRRPVRDDGVRSTAGCGAFDLHMTRLTEGCHRLGMPAPPVDADRDGLRA